MSFNQVPNRHLPTHDYSLTAVRAIVAIDAMNQAVVHTQNLTHSAQLDAEKSRKRKLHLAEINAELQAKYASISIDWSLQHLLQKKTVCRKNISQKKIEKIQIKHPVIEIASMGWAIDYIQEIKENNFSEIKEIVKRERQGLANLAGNIKRYGQKLMMMEEKLQKRYQDARSKKRFI